jgi:hypothetical protein
MELNNYDENDLAFKIDKIIKERDKRISKKVSQGIITFFLVNLVICLFLYCTTLF